MLHRVFFGAAVVCRTAGLAVVLLGAAVFFGAGDAVVTGGGVVGAADGDMVAGLVVGAACVGLGLAVAVGETVFTDPASGEPAGPHAASVKAANPPMTATTVRVIFMAGTVGSARRGPGCVSSGLRSARRRV